MKKRDVILGHVYAVKVSGTLQKVRVTAESSYGGWVGRSLRTGREIRIHRQHACDTPSPEQARRGPGPHAPPPRGAAWAAGWTGWRTGLFLENTDMATKFHPAEESTLVLVKQVTDLAIGDVIQAPGFDGPRTVRRATKVNKGPQKGKLELHLADENGQVDIADFGAEENVQAVGHEDGKKKGEPTAKVSKGKKPAKGAGKKPAEKSDSTPKAEAKPKAGKKAKTNTDAGDKKLSAINAAHKVLVDSGKAMNTQELIAEMTEKGLWTSPGGLTPHATLYSAILRELKAKGGESRFRKVEKGKFAAKTA
jgi:hypothetical protein